MGEQNLHRQSGAPRTILVIEDDRDIARLVELHLHDQGYDVHIAHDGVSGLKQALSHPYDLIVLDLMLPGMEGLEVCRNVRTRPNYTPILMLTARFLARVKALFRRLEALGAQLAPDNHNIIRTGDLMIDTEKRKVTLCDHAIDLTAKEFDLLLQFARHPGRVYTRAQLLDLVWGYAHAGYEHTVNSHINRLRTKIERDTSRPRYILTVWGVGYSFSEEPTHE
jgi:DNA-binding response OmpR family regulator